MVWDNPCSGYCLPFVGVENTLNGEDKAGKEEAVFEQQQVDWLMCKCQCLWNEFSIFRPEGRSGWRVH